MNTLLLGIIIGISVSTLNIILVFYLSKSDKVQAKVSQKVKQVERYFSPQQATIIDMSPEIDLEEQL